MSGGDVFFEELRRSVRFGPDDEAALRELAPLARPSFGEIATAFYQRLAANQNARRVFSSPEQIERLKATMVVWLEGLLTGPWDEAYYQRRARIGRRQVQIESQLYTFAAVDQIRIALSHIVKLSFPDDVTRRLQVSSALHKVLDMELAIMLEAYREAFIEKVEHLERLEKVNLEHRLAVTSAQYDEVVEKGEALITTIDAAGCILLFNAKCEQVTGVSRANAAGRRWLDLFAAPADRETVAARHQDALADLPCHPYEGAVQTPDGNERRVRWHFKTLIGPDSTPLLCAIGVDVTEEHDQAVRTRRAERLASLGTMAAGLAHEIRNPLNAAHLQLSVARRRLARSSGDAGAARAVELAGAEMARLAGLVEDFLQFARPQSLRLERADLCALAREAVALLAREATALGVALEAAGTGAAVVTEFDREKMKQVLLNLARNALEAAGRGGRVRIDVQEQAGSAVMTVEDSGRGFPEDAPIFEPFFTTKVGGTGLGLAIVHRIVADHGGTVAASSRSGNKTVFSVVLPIGHADSGHGTLTA